MEDDFSVEPSGSPGTCTLCHRALSPENDTVDPESVGICGDCKFLFLEDSGTVQRTSPRPRRTRYTTSSESIENMFSQQFSSMIHLARQAQPTVSDHENQSVSSRTTPNGSRRWRRVFSDTESDGFDSVYGESDVVSYSAYGGDSDASVDGLSFAHPDDDSVLNSDTDIDPMQAGPNRWNLDDDDEWEEAETGGNTLGSLVAELSLRGLLESGGRNPPVDWLTDVQEQAVRVRISETRPVEDHHEPPRDVGRSGDYVDARTFEELLERLATEDGSRRGAPPAARWFVDGLDRVAVDDDDVMCAVCKDSVPIGTVVNRLPCLHRYHPSCIRPWLSTRNSCPLCRYELPTDDPDYEDGKRRLRVRETEHEAVGEDMTSDEDERPETVDRPRGGRWFYLGAPIVGLVGLAIVLWLGNPRARGERLFGTRHDAVRANRPETRTRRWWFLF